MPLPTGGFRPLDDVELPGGTRGIQRGAHDVADEVGEHRSPARLWQRQVVHVERGVEAWVVLPARTADAEPGRRDALTEARECDEAGDNLLERGPSERTVQTEHRW